MNLQSAYFALAIVVPTLGIGTNWYVLWRFLRIARRSVIRFKTTSGLPLATMSAGDSVTTEFRIIHVDAERKLQVYSEDGRICAEHPNISSHNVKAAHLIDIALFYAIPSLLRIFFDEIVLFQCYSPFSMMDVPLYEWRYAISVSTHTRRCSFNPEFESSVDVQENMTLVMSISSATTEHFTKKRQLYVKKVKKKTAMILYFSQFICDAFYLSTNIYEASGTPRSTVVVSSGRHISRWVSNDDES
ncbi:hypothetical protein ANCCEY_14869 [Ancylostoma ceylanicum]|uniref:Uncharacterized protein n=1 Tax=Ancylostoma ceylanicum TaxID=53326 RepID=A0A0D6L4T2_9BILA|nr:hypothetical protein ANCCEY_14869 [Ancylostoma ceylanicum]